MIFDKKLKVLIFGILGAILIVFVWVHSFSSRIKKISKNLSFSEDQFAKIEKDKKIKRNFSQVKEIIKEFKKLIEFGKELEIEK